MLEYVFFSFAAAVPEPTSPSFFYRRVRNISGYFINDHDLLQPPRPRVRSLHLIGGPEPVDQPSQTIQPVSPLTAQTCRSGREL